MKLFTSGRYAAVASTLALAVALGGTSYAAVKITGASIQNDTVTTKDIKDKTLKVKDLSPGAVYADAIVHGDGLTALQWREKLDDVTRSVHFPISGPTHIRLERRRNQVRMFAGPQGGQLTDLGYIELSPFTPMYVGLGVCAHDDNAETTAVFSNVNGISPPIRAVSTGVEPL